MDFRIIVAEDEDITRKHLLHALTREGYEVSGARNGDEAIRMIESGHFDVLITDVKMPGMSGIELLELAKANSPDLEVLIITGFGSIDSAVDAMKKGAYEYITKPFNLDELILKIKNLYERKRLKKENVALKAFFGMDRGVSVIARSESMRRIMGIVEEISNSDCPVFLWGESGVGKSLIAKIIHFTSRRRNMPFLTAACSSVPPDLLSGELFGVKEKSVTGGVRIKKGRLEIADTGTIFLEDINDLPEELQHRLFNALMSGEFVRVDGMQPVKCNVRLMAAARQGPKSLIDEGRLNRDLFYQLNMMEMFIPPLREHREDIEPLSRYFLQKHLPETNKEISGLTEESLGILEGYSFPGNVRELENIIERALMLEKTSMITPESLPRSIRMFQIETFQPDSIVTIDEMTKEYAKKVLGLMDGDKVRAAELLGVTELELRRMLKP